MESEEKINKLLIWCKSGAEVLEENSVGCEGRKRVGRKTLAFFVIEMIKQSACESEMVRITRENLLSLINEKN